MDNTTIITTVYDGFDEAQFFINGITPKQYIEIYQYLINYTSKKLEPANEDEKKEEEFNKICQRIREFTTKIKEEVKEVKLEEVKLEEVKLEEVKEEDEESFITDDRISFVDGEVEEVEELNPYWTYKEFMDMSNVLAKKNGKPTKESTNKKHYDNLRLIQKDFLNNDNGENIYYNEIVNRVEDIAAWLRETKGLSVRKSYNFSIQRVYRLLHYCKDDFPKCLNDELDIIMPAIAALRPKPISNGQEIDKIEKILIEREAMFRNKINEPNATWYDYQKLIAFILYARTAPRRSDIGHSMIVDEIDKNSIVNQINIKTGEIFFPNFKTEDTMGPFEHYLSEEVLNLTRRMLELRDKDYPMFFFLKQDGDVMDQDSGVCNFIRGLGGMYRVGDKSKYYMTMNDFRKLWSKKIANVDYEKMRMEQARLMGHSVSTSNRYYVGLY